jgi:hypothetical protein
MVADMVAVVVVERRLTSSQCSGGELIRARQLGRGVPVAPLSPESVELSRLEHSRLLVTFPAKGCNERSLESIFVRLLVSRNIEEYLLYESSILYVPSLLLPVAYKARK